jgi:hypothetical protein
MDTVYLDDVESHVEPIDTDYSTNTTPSVRPWTEPSMNYLTPEKLKDPRLTRYRPIERKLPKKLKRTQPQPLSQDVVYASLIDYLSAQL